MNKNQMGIVPNKHGGSIINGIKLDAESIANERPPGGNRFYKSPEAVVHRLYDNLAKIMTLAQDVFITPLDLAFLDRSHNVLGGGANEEFDDGDEGVFAAEQEIIQILHALTPRPPFYEAGNREAYFIPALTMPLDRRVDFAQISDSERLLTALDTKIVFVYGAGSFGYGRGEKCLPDDDFWNTLFGSCDDTFTLPEASAASIEAAKITKFGPVVALGFWLERCIQRDVGFTHLMDQLDLDELCAGREENLAESIKAIKNDCGWRFPPDLYSLKYFGAVGNPRG